MKQFETIIKFGVLISLSSAVALGEQCSTVNKACDDTASCQVLAGQLSSDFIALQSAAPIYNDANGNLVPGNAQNFLVAAAQIKFGIGDMLQALQPGSDQPYKNDLLPIAANPHFIIDLVLPFAVVNKSSSPSCNAVNDLNNALNDLWAKLGVIADAYGVPFKAIPGTPSSSILKTCTTNPPQPICSDDSSCQAATGKLTKAWAGMQTASASTPVDIDQFLKETGSLVDASRALYLVVSRQQSARNFILMSTSELGFGAIRFEKLILPFTIANNPKSSSESQQCATARFAQKLSEYGIVVDAITTAFSANLSPAAPAP